MTELATIEEALQDLREGKLILVIDDPDRENEGDLICAAEFATAENVNTMATLAKGLICMPMSSAMTEKLQLNQMVEVNTDNHATAFTVSIDHVDTTTGISAVERSLTAMKCVEDGVKPEDFSILPEGTIPSAKSLPRSKTTRTILLPSFWASRPE